MNLCVFHYERVGMKHRDRVERWEGGSEKERGREPSLNVLVS